MGGVRGGLVNTILGGGLVVWEVDRFKKERIKGEWISGEDAVMSGGMLTGGWILECRNK